MTTRLFPATLAVAALPRPWLSTLALAALLSSAPWAHAAGDHGHDHDHGPAAPAGPALPRFAAVSELFELVGVLDGKHLILYLDRAADNVPVTEAQIELEIGGARLKAAKHGTDEFEVILATEPQPGVLPIVATITAGSDTDLLAGELDIHGAAPADAAPIASWRQYAAWVLATLAVLVFLGRRGRTSRPVRDGGAA
jgi:hypothetical protein